jgi:hypothetical protein
MKLKIAGAALLAAALVVPFSAHADRDDKPHKYANSRTVQYVYLDGHARHDVHERRKIDQRQHEQHERIAQGLRSGELTRREADRLMHEQREIRELERQFLADGHLSSRERGALHAELNEASRHIHHEKNDRQRYR